MRFFKTLFLFAALAGMAAAAFAQQISPIPQVTSVGPTDLFQDLVAGQPTAQSYYAPAKLISGVDGYSLTVPLTGFAITVPNGTAQNLINPAGTLATGAFTMMPNPGDGQRTCLMSSQTQTAVTVSGNTGQTISTAFLAALTAMTANTRYCYLYSAPASTWYRVQ